MFHFKATLITNGVTSLSFSARKRGGRWLLFRVVCLPLALKPNTDKIWIQAPQPSSPIFKESFISIFLVSSQASGLQKLLQ